MLKIILLIQCDICNGVLNEITVAEKPEEVPEEVHDLQLTAEEHSWQLSRNSTVHYCPGCTRS